MAEGRHENTHTDICTTEKPFTGSDANDFELPATTRTSLSAILIVHPIAALLTLICFCLATAAHFHGPSSSPRYLLALLILTIPTLLVTLLAFLVDILLFVPHMQWGGWIVLAATVLIIASSVLTCAMRRTLVSRKARKARIAENADMSGASSYDGLNQNRLMADTPQLPRADSPPPMSGSTVVNNDKNGMLNGTQYATFEMKRHDGDVRRSVSDDQVPLNPIRSRERDPSIRSASTGRNGNAFAGDGAAPPMPVQRDAYGNVISGPGMGMAGAVMAAGDLPEHRGLRHQGSQGSLGSQGTQGSGRGGYGPRGRGGYGPPSRGGGGYGSPNRGGPYGGPQRGGYGGPPPMNGRGGPGGYRGQGPPPQNWRGGGQGRGGYGAPLAAGAGIAGAGMMMGRDGQRQPPPPTYAGDTGGRYSPQMGRGPQPGSFGQPSPTRDQYAGPIGQAIEMDERTGTGSPPVDSRAVGYGAVGGGGEVRQPGGRDEVRSPESVYSDV